MIKKKLNILKLNIRKIGISLKLFCVFLLLLFQFVTNDSLAFNNSQKQSVISKAWETVFNNPQSTIDFCIPILNETVYQKDTLFTAELNRLVGTAFYNISDYPKSIEYFTKSLSFYFQVNNSLQIADLYNDIGSSYLGLNRLQESKDYFLNALNLFEKLERKKDVSIVLSNIGLCYYYKSDYVNSVSYFLKALNIADKLNDKELISMHLNNLGMIYKMLKNYDQALMYYNKAKQIYQTYNNIHSLSIVLNNIGNIYYQQNKFDKALDYYQQSLDLKRKINNKNGIATTLANFGEVYENGEDYVKTLDYYNQALKIMEEINCFSGVILTTDCIGRVYYKQKYFKKAELVFLRSVELSKINKIPVKTAHQFLSEIYKDKGDYEKSLYHLQKSADIEELVFGSDKVHQINKLLANYETAQKDEEISILTESNKLKEEQIRERTIFIVILAFMFFALVVSIILVVRNSNRIKHSQDELKEVNRILKETNDKLNTTLKELQSEIENRKQIEQQLINAQEKLSDSLEKAKELNELKTRFIAMVSHEYRNPLTVIMNVAEMLPIYNRQENPENHDRYIQMIKHQVDIMVKLLNDVLIIGKKGSSQQNLNIMTMPIMELCKNVITNAKFVDEEKHNIILSTTPSDEVITTDVQHLTHALSNILANSTKYSALGTDIFVNVSSERDFIKIAIKDIGIGIPEQDKQLIFEAFHRGDNIGSIPGNGLGLSIVKMYMDLLGGKIDFESNENVGSTFTVTLPKVFK